MIRIVTDSSCDLPDDLLDRHRIAMVPLTIRFGDEDLVDRVDIDVDAFWERLTSSDTLPETAAPPVGRFFDAFRTVEAEGAEGIVCICISSAISATHQSAVLAAEEFRSGIPVSILDSRLVSGALGLTAIAAAEKAATGAGMEEVEEAAAEAAGASNLFATLDTLEFLKRGGRIGAAQAFFGNLLSVKPLISFADGAVAAAGRVRTRSKAINAVAEHVDALERPIERLAIVHSDPPDLDHFLARIDSVYEGERRLFKLGAVAGTHAGPGVAGVVYRLG